MSITNADVGSSVLPNQFVVLGALDEASNLIVVVFDDAQRLVWMNRRGRDALGVAENAVDRTSVLDLIDPRDLMRAAESLLIGEQLLERGEVDPSTGAYPEVRISLRGRSGPLKVQASFHSFIDRDGSRRHVALARIEPDAATAQEVVQALMAGSPVATTVPIAQAMVPSHLGTSVVVHWANSELETFLGAGLDIDAHHAFAAPMLWERVRRDGNSYALTSLQSLPRGIAATVDAHGFKGLWAVPIPRPQDADPLGCMLVWTRMPLPPVLGIEEMLAAAAQMVALAVLSDASTRWLTEAANSDMLTGLMNRRGFEERLMKQREPFAALYLDLDDFKPINDEYGHHVGDLVLQEVSARLAAVIRSQDSVARLGGDEFAVMCAALTDEMRISEIATRVFDSISQPMEIDGLTLSVSVTIGTAVVQPGDLDSLRRADRALIAAKRAGKRQIFFDR